MNITRYDAGNCIQQLNKQNLFGRLLKTFQIVKYIRKKNWMCGNTRSCDIHLAIFMSSTAKSQSVLKNTQRVAKMQNAVFTFYLAPFSKVAWKTNKNCTFRTLVKLDFLAQFPMISGFFSYLNSIFASIYRFVETFQLLIFIKELNFCINYFTFI